MSYTYDITTSRGKVRLGLADASGTDGTASTYVFEDAEVDYFLSVGGSVDGGISRGLRVLLVDAARRAKSFSLQGLSMDDTARISAIQAALALYGDAMPTIAPTLPAPLPMDDGFDASDP